MKMKAIILVSVLWCAVPFISCGANWAKTWGGISNDAAHSVAVDGSGNVYVVGAFVGTVDFDTGSGTNTQTSHGKQDAFLCKYNSSGAFQWAKTWGGIGRDVANAVALDDSGRVYVTGPFQNTVDFNPNPSVTSNRASNAGAMNNIYISKFDPDGNLEWVKTWGPSDGGAESYGLAVDASNNVYAVGDFAGSTCNFNPWNGGSDIHTNHIAVPLFFDAWLSKFDSNGNFKWARTWGGEGYDDGPGVAVDGSGNVYVAGMYASITNDFDPGPGVCCLPAHNSGFVCDVFLSKFNSQGTFQWARTWGQQGYDDIADVVVVDGENNVYLAGRYASPTCNFNPWGTADIHTNQGGAFDAWVSKFNSSGTFQWARTWGGNSNDPVGGLAVDAANRLYVLGTFGGTVDFDPAPASFDIHVSNGKEDVALSLFDSTGDFLWAGTWGGTGSDWGYRLAVDGVGPVYATGSFSNSCNFNPWGGADIHATQGQADAFLCKIQLTIGDANLSAVALTNSVVLSWDAPTSFGLPTNMVYIRHRTDRYPTNATDGTEVYTGTAQTFEHTGRDSSGTVTNYYTIWGNDGSPYAVMPGTVNASASADPGRIHIIWQNLGSGSVYYWALKQSFANNDTIKSSGYMSDYQLKGWSIVGSSDFDADGVSDILWQNTNSGSVFYWLLTRDYQIKSSGYACNYALQGWDVKSVTDFNGDGTPDVLWQNRTSGVVFYWVMKAGTAWANNDTIASSGYCCNYALQGWDVKAVLDE